MKFGVVVFPGSNCDQDMVYALRNDMQQEVVTLWHKDNHLSNLTPTDCIILPGGFSYGDYLRCGALARFSPIMEQVIQFAMNGGKVLGICNGFQILCEAGLLEGALLQNEQQKFVCKNVFIHSQNKETLLTKNITNEALMIPVAHGEGRYYADEATLKSLEINNQILFTYCDENGKENNDANPNGAIKNIAGICNKNKNVFGMMPHPERACNTYLGNMDGKKIIQQLINNN